MTSRPDLRIGVLGAARIVKGALLQPAQTVPGVTVAAIAARDPRRAEQFAARHGISHVRRGYDELLNDPDVDAVYVPLPAALHERWTIAAIDAGKHVLCEKPFTSNASAARRVAHAAESGGLVVMEAYHSHYHPLHARLQQLVASGELGTITHASAEFCVPIPPGKDIRWNLALGGGGLLDVGYYPVRLLRELFGGITTIHSTRARDRNGVDRLLIADVTLGGRVRASVTSSMWSARGVGMKLRVHGTDGIMTVTRPYHPHVIGSKVLLRSRNGRRFERTSRRSTYTGQLETFRDAVIDQQPFPTTAAAAVAQMTALDQLYEAAGLRPRP